MPWDPDLSWPIQSTSWQLLHLLSTSYCHWWHTHFLSSRPLFGVLLHLILHLILWLHTPSNNKHNLCGFSYLNTISQTTSKRRMIYYDINLRENGGTLTHIRGSSIILPKYFFFCSSVPAITTGICWKKIVGIAIHWKQIKWLHF